MDNNNLRQPHPYKMMLLQASMGTIPNSHLIIEADEGEGEDGYGIFDSEDHDGAICYGFIPDGDCMFAEMEESGVSVSDERLAYEYSDRVFVPGRFTKLAVSEGKVNLFLIKV